MTRTTTTVDQGTTDRTAEIVGTLSHSRKRTRDQIADLVDNEPATKKEVRQIREQIAALVRRMDTQDALLREIRQLLRGEQVKPAKPKTDPYGQANGLMVRHALMMLDRYHDAPTAYAMYNRRRSEDPEFDASGGAISTAGRGKQRKKYLMAEYVRNDDVNGLGFVRGTPIVTAYAWVIAQLVRIWDQKDVSEDIPDDVTHALRALAKKIGNGSVYKRDLFLKKVYDTLEWNVPSEV